ncbi:MAG TPA: hypothetical protein VLM79_03835 [Kofleriaceae bacterium]|nr:hypothetical protein [Kofleriaceae bacterium]
MNLLGNLDCEAGWAGVALPEPVLQRISLYAALFAACAPEPVPSGDPADLDPADREPADRDPDDRDPADLGRAGREGAHQIWVPARVDPARLVAHRRWTPPALRVGEPPPGVELRWADPNARDANDRAGTLAIAEILGVALRGARVVSSLAELDAHVGGFAGQPWVCKARWTAAGRDRAHGTGSPIAGPLRERIGRMFERFGPLVFEPWLDRVADLGLCGEVREREVVLAEPHRLVTDPRGGFLGIELDPAVDRGIADALEEVARPAAELLAARTGYRGPFAIDAFVYRDRGALHLHPLCELNARHTFGWIARALGRRLGIRRLGFDAPPHAATVLIAPGDDRVTAWCA